MIPEKFEDQVKQRGKAFHLEPRDDVWSRIAADLDKKKKKRPLGWWLFTGMLILSAAGYFIFYVERKDTLTEGLAATGSRTQVDPGKSETAGILSITQEGKNLQQAQIPLSSYDSSHAAPLHDSLHAKADRFVTGSAAVNQDLIHDSNHGEVPTYFYSDSVRAFKLSLPLTDMRSNSFHPCIPLNVNPAFISQPSSPPSSPGKVKRILSIGVGMADLADNGLRRETIYGNASGAGGVVNNPGNAPVNNTYKPGLSLSITYMQHRPLSRNTVWTIGAGYNYTGITYITGNRINGPFNVSGYTTTYAYSYTGGNENKLKAADHRLSIYTGAGLQLTPGKNKLMLYGGLQGGMAYTDKMYIPYQSYRLLPYQGKKLRPVLAVNASLSYETFKGYNISIFASRDMVRAYKPVNPGNPYWRQIQVMLGLPLYKYKTNNK